MKFVVFIALLTASASLRAASSEEKTVIAAVQKLFDAMEHRDEASIRSLVLPGVVFAAVRADGKATTTPVEKFAETIASAKEVLLEKMWDPKVMVQGNIATLWAPYDFHRGNTYTHCGIDTFSLLKVGEEWKIASVTYTVQTQSCASK